MQNVKRLVAETLRVAPKKATRMINQARLLAEVLTPTGHITPAALPVVREAARAGELDGDHIDAISHTLETLPAGISIADRELLETTLVDTARVFHAQIVRRHGDRIVAHLEQNEPAAEREQAEPANIMTYRRSRDGRVRIVAELDAETADVFEGLITPLAVPQKDVPEVRDQSRRQGDAMAEVIFRAAGKGSDVPVKPELIVTMDLNMLMEGLGSATLDSGTYLCPSAVRRLACDAHVIPVVFNGDSQPLDVGHAHRLVQRHQRDALIARDKGCAFPGCDIPARWGDAHHIKHWKEGGPTDLHNLVLLCRRHHRIVHGNEWSITMVHGLPHFIPPVWVDCARKPMRNLLRTA